MLTEQVLRRSAALDALNSFAAAHHETAPRNRHHKRLSAEAFDPNAGILVAADIYSGLRSDRADRPRLSDADAAAEVRRLIMQGALDKRTANALLVAAGHSESRGRRVPNTGGLSSREIRSCSLPPKASRPEILPSGFTFLPRRRTITFNTFTRKSEFPPVPRPPCGPRKI